MRQKQLFYGKVASNLDDPTKRNVTTFCDGNSNSRMGLKIKKNAFVITLNLDLRTQIRISDNEYIDF